LALSFRTKGPGQFSSTTRTHCRCTLREQSVNQLVNNIILLVWDAFFIFNSYI